MNGQEQILLVLNNLLKRAQAGQIETLSFGAFTPDEDEPNFGVVGDMTAESAIAMISLNKVVESHLINYLTDELAVPIYEGTAH